MFKTFYPGGGLQLNFNLIDQEIRSSCFVGTKKRITFADPLPLARPAYHKTMKGGMPFMTHVLACIIFLGTAVTPYHIVFSQGKTKARAEVSAPIVKDKPAPYISFERAGKRHPVLNGESDEGIWLRLHNNTRWAIRLDMSGIPQEYGNANLFYEVLSGNKVVVDMRCHVCSNNKLASGKSIVFSVPREFLNKDLAIRISFNYEWELDDHGSTSLERQHYVYFYASSLSKAMTLPSLVESHSRPTIKKVNVAGRAPAAMP